jgi:hypothetical protein
MPAAIGNVGTSAPPSNCDLRLQEDFVPLTRTDRAVQYVQALVGPQAIIFTLAQAAVNTGLNDPEAWDQQIHGFALRTASGYGMHVISTSFEAGIALGLGEDNRYFLSGEQGFGPRLRYAVESSFLARRDSGRRTFSWSAVGGTAAGSFISRLWLPDGSNGVGNALVSFGLNTAARVGLNVAHEFAPRFVQRLLQ